MTAEITLKKSGIVHRQSKKIKINPIPDSVDNYFGQCSNYEFGDEDGCEELGREDSQCCEFAPTEVMIGVTKGKYCVNTFFRAGVYSGKYLDNNEMMWSWKCKEPKPLLAKNRDKDVPPFSNYLKKDMELWIWVAYMAGAFWFPGWFIMVPVGTIVYTYNFVDGLYHAVLLLLGRSQGDWEEWVQGPLERMFVGPLILSAAFWMASVPVLNIVSSFLLGWLAQLDYYGYHYRLGFGP